MTPSQLPTDSESLGLRIKLLRTQRRLRLQDLAQAAGLSLWHLCKIEAGKHSPRADTLRQIAQALGVPVTELLGNSAAQQGPATRREEIISTLVNQDRILLELELELSELQRKHREEQRLYAEDHIT